MSWRGEVEDGGGWEGLVPSKSERREEARMEALKKDAQRYRKMRAASMDERTRLEHYAGQALDEALDALALPMGGTQ